MYLVLQLSKYFPNTIIYAYINHCNYFTIESQTFQLENTNLVNILCTAATAKLCQSVFTSSSNGKR